MKNNLVVTLPVKQFMLTEHCPSDWRVLDLYLFRDEDLVFYVGQSYLAFDRVWEHLRHGFRGRSVMGRFILCNWPKSLNYQIDLLSSQSSQFAPVQHNLNAAEAELIQRWSPCFNQTLNHQPTPLPDQYTPPSAPLRCSRNLHKLMREAERAVKADERRRWLTLPQATERTL
jgi:hypothetical protein